MRFSVRDRPSRLGESNRSFDITLVGVAKALLGKPIQYVDSMIADLNATRHF